MLLGMICKRCRSDYCKSKPVIRHYEQKFCMQPECPFLPTLRHILAFVAWATRLRVFLG